ncbi:MAG TPA: hypothetical protein VHN77_02565 [Phycisphaerales bacterium]|nr:hypothetical protein [Phycisphaerales bacterium]
MLTTHRTLQVTPPADTRHSKPPEKAATDPTLPSALDLRRIRQRAQSDLILRRAEHLPDRDSAVLFALFRAEQTAAEVAVLQHTDARSVRRTARRLVARVLAPEFTHVISHHQRWERERQAVARLRFIEGRSIRDIARALSLSTYTVRGHCTWIRASAAAGTEAKPHLHACA